MDRAHGCPEGCKQGCRVSRIIHLVRHAEPAATWGADPDPGLSGLGHQQAAALAGGLPEAVELWTSPMARCRQTAAPLATRLGHTPLVVPAVSEIPMPQGLDDPRSWLTSVLHGQWADQTDEIRSWRDAAVAAVAGAAPADTPLVIFTHFIAINAIVSAITGEGRVTCFQPGHASITTLQLDAGRLTLVAKGAEQAIVLT
jgi:broad specificity phosphatase PhoE